MKVYVVYGGWDYEGDYGQSIRVFSSKEKAEEYSEKLTEDTYHYVNVDEHEVDAE